MIAQSSDYGENYSENIYFLEFHEGKDDFSEFPR